MLSVSSERFSNRLRFEWLAGTSLVNFTPRARSRSDVILRMKQHRWLILLALMASLTACRPGHKAEAIVGEWYARDDERGLFSRLNFHENGRFDGYVDFQNKRAATFEGTWRLNQNTLDYTYAKCEPIKLFKDGKDQDVLLEVTKTYYTFRTAKGEVHRYDRFREGQATVSNQPK
jgi:hypothetical protein